MPIVKPASALINPRHPHSKHLLSCIPFDEGWIRTGFVRDVVTNERYTISRTSTTNPYFAAGRYGWAVKNVASNSDRIALGAPRLHNRAANVDTTIAVVSTFENNGSQVIYQGYNTGGAFDGLGLAINPGGGNGATIGFWVGSNDPNWRILTLSSLFDGEPHVFMIAIGEFGANFYVDGRYVGNTSARRPSSHTGTRHLFSFNGSAQFCNSTFSGFWLFGNKFFSHAEAALFAHDPFASVRRTRPLMAAPPVLDYANLPVWKSVEGVSVKTTDSQGLTIASSKEGVEVKVKNYAEV